MQMELQKHRGPQENNPRGLPLEEEFSRRGSMVWRTNLFSFLFFSLSKDFNDEMNTTP